MIQCEGQIEMTDYLKSKIKSGRVKDLTAWINSQGKAQYTQIEEVVRETYEKENDYDNAIKICDKAISFKHEADVYKEKKEKLLEKMKKINNT